MKKILYFCLMFIMAFSLLACNKEKTEERTPEIEKLSTPVVSISEDGLASWSKVKNASGYAYKINDGKTKETDELDVQLEYGDYIRVKALGDGEKYEDSSYSKAVTYGESTPNTPEVTPTVVPTEPTNEIGFFYLSVRDDEKNEIAHYYMTKDSSFYIDFYMSKDLFEFVGWSTKPNGNVEFGPNFYASFDLFVKMINYEGQTINIYPVWEMQSDISGYDGYSETFDVNNYWKSSDEGVYTVKNDYAPWDVYYEKIPGYPWSCLTSNYYLNGGDFNYLNFEMQMEKGKSFIVKVEGWDGAVEETFFGTGEVCRYSLDLRMLSEYSMNALDKVMIFAEGGNDYYANGYFTIYSMYFSNESVKDYTEPQTNIYNGDGFFDINKNWYSNDLDVYTIGKDMPVMVRYEKTWGYEWSYLGNNVDMNGSAFTLLAFGIEAPLNVPYIIKVEGNTPTGLISKEISLYGTGNIEVNFLDLSEFSSKELSYINKVYVFMDCGNSNVSGEFYIHQMNFDCKVEVEDVNIYDGYSEIFDVNNYWHGNDLDVYTVNSTNAPWVINYNKMEWHAWSALTTNIQGDLSKFDTLEFEMNVAKGIKFIVKLEGGGHATEIVCEGKGSYETYSLSLSNLTYEQLGAFNKVYIFMDYGNYKATSGQFKIKSMYFANSQTSDVFAYTGTYEGKASYNEIDGTYSFSVDLNIWNRITLVYNGTALSMQDLNVTGAFTYSNMAPWDTTLFCDAPDDYSLVDWTTLICSCSNNVTYTFTYNPITNTLRIDAKEDNGVPEIPANGFYIEVFDTNAFVYGSNTDETTVNLKQWWRVKLYFDGNPLSVNDITITGDYGYFDMSNKDLYNDSAEGDNIILCDYYSENGIQYTFSYDRYTNTLDIQDDEKEVVEELPVNGFFYRYTAVDTTLMPWQEVYPASDTTYTFVVELNAWRYVEIYYNGKQISITDSYFTYNLFDGVYIDGMYTERFYVNSTNTYEFVYTPAIYSAYADLLARKYDEPQGPIETDGYVFKVSSDEYAAVFTDSNALVDTKSRWRLYIVVDDKGKIAYMCEFPINGYGGPADNTYIRHSDYSDYMSNPAFNILDGYAPWQPGYNYYNLYEVKVPFGGFALELYSGDEDVQKFMKAITGISYCEHAINDNSINVDNIRLTYDYADKVRVSIVKEEPTEPEVPGIKEVYLGTFGSTDIKAYATLDGNLLTMRYEAVDAYSVGEINQFFIFDNDVVYEVRFNQASWTGIWNWTTSNWEYWTSQIAVPTYMTENGLYVMTQVIDLEYFTNLGLDVSTIKFNVGENLIGETNLIHNGNRVDFNNHSTWVVLAGTLNIFVDRYNDGGWGDTTTWTYLSNNLSGDFKVVTVFEMETNDFESNWWRGVLPIVQHETGSNLNDGSCWVTRFDWWGWCDQWYSNDKLTNIWSDAGANQNIIVDCYWSDELGNDVSANDFVLAMTKSTITWTCTRNGNTVRNDFVITLEDGRVFTYWSLADDIDINKNLNIALSAEFAKYTVKSITVQ